MKLYKSNENQSKLTKTRICTHQLSYESVQIDTRNCPYLNPKLLTQTYVHTHTRACTALHSCKRCIKYHSSRRRQHQIPTTTAVDSKIPVGLSLAVTFPSEPTSTNTRKSREKPLTPRYGCCMPK